MAGLSLLLLVAIVAALAPGVQAVDPPFATIAAPGNNTTFDAGATIVFSANGSTDPDGGPLYFIWDFPNETIEGAGAKWIYFANFTAPGTYFVRLTVRDNESLEAYANVTVNVRPPNLPPAAVIAAPATGSHYYTDQVINFSANGSSDPEDGPLAYFWSTNLSGQFGTGELVPNVRLVAGRHLITLRVVDDHGANDTATVLLTVDVNVAPHIQAAPVAALSGFEGDSFDFTANYTEENGEPAARVILVFDGTPYAMQFLSGSDPRAGQLYSATVTPAAGRHTFYVLADDGNFTNLTAVQQGPDVWQNVTLLSADQRASLTLAVLPPSNISLVRWTGALPSDPALSLAVSPGYRVEGTALDASNFTLTIAYQPDAQVNASSARVHRVEGSSWLTLVTVLDGAAHVGTVEGSAAEIPATYRIFAARASPPANAPPSLEIKFGGDLFPNATVSFDAGNSSDPEGGALLLAWNFTGPGGSTGWLPGKSVALAFPVVGLYVVSLRGDDGSGNIAFKNITLEVRERPAPPTGSLEEPVTLAALAGAVGLSALLAVWWRGRRAPRKKKYDDLYGALYHGRFAEETEYTQLFEKYADPLEGGDPQPPGLEPPEVDEP